MVKAYHEKKCSDLQFCSRTAVNLLYGNDLMTRDSEMEAVNENWVWRNADNPYQVCHRGKTDRWSTSENIKCVPLDPPLEFQDNPIESLVEKFAVNFISKLISEAFVASCNVAWSIPCSQVCHRSDPMSLRNAVLWNGLRFCWTSELSQNSKPQSALSGRLSTSHQSLSTISSSNMDVSDHIKSAISHDVLTTKQISDMYNVPFDSDIYAVPVDVVRGGRRGSSPRDDNPYGRPGRTCDPSSGSGTTDPTVTSSDESNSSQSKRRCGVRGERLNGLVRPTQRPATAVPSSTTEPIHVTVDEVHQYLKTLYVNTAEMTEGKGYGGCRKVGGSPLTSLPNNSYKLKNEENILNTLKTRGNYTVSVGRSKKIKENVNSSANGITGSNRFEARDRHKKWSTCRPSFSANLKETLCNIFRFKKMPEHCLGRRDVVGSCVRKSDEVGIRLSGHDNQNPPSPITKPPFSKRALPPLPGLEDTHGEIIVTDSTPLPSPEEVSPQPPGFRSKDSTASVDFASSIEKVKDCGWYWGPISGKVAEKILSNEPDGSFIVRDSSDDYYIFSLTFKLNSIIRHVRIEHDQGNFSFGNSTRFKSHTIVDFIESAVEHSRSGRYLFFLHRRPVLGPMRVQLLHPVSRFKQVQSLQHMCRFVILKTVRRDLIRYLPLPRRILDYLSTQHYYSENLLGDDRSDSSRDEQLDQLWPFDRESFS